MSAYRDPEPFTVEQINEAFMYALVWIDKATYDERGFDLVARGMHARLGVDVVVEPYRRHERGLRVCARAGTEHEQRFVRVWNRGGFEVEA